MYLFPLNIKVNLRSIGNHFFPQKKVMLMLMLEMLIGPRNLPKVSKRIQGCLNVGLPDGLYLVQRRMTCAMMTLTFNSSFYVTATT